MTFSDIVMSVGKGLKNKKVSPEDAKDENTCGKCQQLLKREMVPLVNNLTSHYL